MAQEDKLTDYPLTISKHKSSDNRLDSLLALRGFACLMVILSHSEPVKNSIHYQNYDLSWIIFSSGKLGVWIFFVLSGFLMGKAFYSGRYTADVPGVKNFWCNRLLRICPLYYFAILILCLFLYPPMLKIENWGYLVRLITFTYNQSLPIVFTGCFWSLSTEMQFYLLVPFIYSFLKPRLLKRRQILIASFWCLFIVFILRLVVWLTLHEQVKEQASYWLKYWYTPSFMNLDLFLCGFLINSLLTCEHLHVQINIDKVNNLIVQSSKLKFMAVILLIGLYLFTSHHYYYQEFSTGIRTATTFFILQPLTALIISFFIFAFECDQYQDLNKNEKLSFGSILRNPLRVLEILGNLSYGLYIWHGPMLVNFKPVFTSNIPIEAFYSRLTATLILSTLLTVVTYYLVEIPSNQWKIYRAR